MQHEETMSNDKDKPRYRNLQDFGRNHREQFRSHERGQSEEQRNFVEAQNMALLIKRVTDFDQQLRESEKREEDRAKKIDSQWLDMKREINDCHTMLKNIWATLEAWGKPVVQVQEPAPSKRKMGLAQGIMDLMSDGHARHIYQVYTELKAKCPNNEGWPEMSVGTTCSNLAARGKLKLLRRGLYEYVRPSTEVQAEEVQHLADKQDGAAPPFIEE